LTVLRFVTVPLSAVHSIIAEFAGTFSAVLKNDGTILAVDGISFFFGTFLAVPKKDGTTFGGLRNWTVPSGRG